MATWLTLWTKPKMERQVRDLLNCRGIEVYLPVLHRFSTHRRRTVPVPFFPCYLFAAADPSSSDLTTLSWVPGMRCVVRIDGRPAVVPASVIKVIRDQLARLERNGDLAQSSFKTGDLVRITSGPMKGLEAVFDRNLSPEGRVRVLLDFLGRLTACELEADSLVRVG